MKKLIGIFLIILSVLFLGGLSYVGYSVITTDINSKAMQDSMDGKMAYIQNYIQMAQAQGTEVDPSATYELNGIIFSAEQNNMYIQMFNLLKFVAYLFILFGFFLSGTTFFKGLKYLSEGSASNSSPSLKPAVNEISFDENTTPEEYNYYQPEAPVTNYETTNEAPVESASSEENSTEE